MLDELPRHPPGPRAALHRPAQRRGADPVAVERQGEWLLYRVADTGIGIASEHVDGLFTEFRQADPTVAQEFGGTGLGLSLVKSIIDRHNGQIRFYSVYGKGSLFGFAIPLPAKRKKGKGKTRKRIKSIVVSL